MSTGTVVVIGAGPAGLTAALELLRRTDYRVIVLEASGDLGGLSKTVNHNGFRIDIGGHRFFSKSDWVMDWWQDILPVAAPADVSEVAINYHRKRRTVQCQDRPLPHPDDSDVMLVRPRLSRIHFEGQFLPYPLKPSFGLALKLGPSRVLKFLASYAASQVRPRRPEVSLEDFLINRFGRELYLTFFKAYTEKVWGVPCSEISAEWGAQRIKGLSIAKALKHAIRRALSRGPANTDGPTSLIEQFLYPRFGPGHMWETVAKRIQESGGIIQLRHAAIGFDRADNRIVSVTARDEETQEVTHVAADHVISTMPVVDLINGMAPTPPEAVTRVANGLQYRDFITVGLLLRKLRKTHGAIPGSPVNLVPDNWIYIQDEGVQVGRLQFFNNWSPSLVPDPNTVWIGMEYFCREGDALWELPDDELCRLAISELDQLGLGSAEDLLDSVAIRMPKAYPAYYGSYKEFDTIRRFTDSIDNLFLIGRNGMHRYNNQDHSMLTARHAVDIIARDRDDKSAIWSVNIDDEYHEEA
jgi:protoporphyrinogen oxidase